MVCAHKERSEAYRFDALPLYRCSACGLIFSDKHGDDLDAAFLYRDYYRNEICGRFRFGIEYLIRAFRFFRAFKIFTIYPIARSILDIGSGRGFMLYYLKKYYGYDRAAGTQISRSAYEFSRDTLKLEMYDKDLLDIPFERGSFDIVTMWHVLEHVTHPERYIERISEILRSGGRIVIEVPNFNSWSRRLTGRYWLGLDLDYHITFFTPESMVSLIQKYGFKIRATRTFSLEYSTFFSAQSIASLMTGSQQIFFRLLQTSGFNRALILHGILVAVLTPFCFLANIALYFSKKGEVLLVIAEKA